MAEDEPILVFTDDQVQQMERPAPVAKEPEKPNPEEIDLGRKIWRLALIGKSHDEIATKLKIEVHELDKALQAFHTRRGVQYFQLMDNERLERLIAFYMPIATERMRVARVKNEEVVIAEDFDRPMKAAYFIMQAMSSRPKILGLKTSEGSAEPAAGGLQGAKQYSERNIAVWLSVVMPSIEKITREAEVIEVKPCPT